MFHYFRVPKKFENLRGGYQDFPSKIFCLTVPKIFVEEPFIVSLYSGTENVWIGGGGCLVSRFSVLKILSHCAENFRRGILSCGINFGYRKSLERRGRGVITIFHRKFFVSQCQKIS